MRGPRVMGHRSIRERQITKARVRVIARIGIFMRGPRVMGVRSIKERLY